MRRAERGLLILLALSAGACSHFRAARARPRLPHPLERGAYGFELGRSLRQIEAAAQRQGLARRPDRFSRQAPLELRCYDVSGATAAHVTVTLMDGRAQGVTAAFAKEAPAFESLAADLAGRYGPPQFKDDQDLYWTDGWTALRLSQRKIDGFEARFLEVVEIPRLGKIGFSRFDLDRAVVFGPKGFAVRDLPPAASPVIGCAAPPASRSADPSMSDARRAVYDGDFAKAVELADRVIQGGLQDEAEAQAWQARAAALYRLGRKDAAREAWKRAYELDFCLSEIPAFLKREGL